MEECLGKETDAGRYEGKDDDCGILKFEVLAEEGYNKHLWYEVDYKPGGDQVAVSLSGDLVLKAVKHEPNHSIAGVDQSWYHKDQNHQCDPKSILVRPLFKCCFETSKGEGKDTVAHILNMQNILRKV